ncbi:hypothetical protein EBI_25760, partial [Enterocytozoon bieneusi H348]
SLLKIKKMRKIKIVNLKKRTNPNHIKSKVALIIKQNQDQQNQIVEHNARTNLQHHIRMFCCNEKCRG